MADGPLSAVRALPADLAFGAGVQRLPADDWLDRADVVGSAAGCDKVGGHFDQLPVLVLRPTPQEVDCFLGRAVKGGDHEALRHADQVAVDENGPQLLDLVLQRPQIPIVHGITVSEETGHLARSLNRQGPIRLPRSASGRVICSNSTPARTGRTRTREVRRRAHLGLP